MGEQENLRRQILKDPNLFSFGVYSDLLDENNLDSSTWREPPSILFMSSAILIIGNKSKAIKDENK